MSTNQSTVPVLEKAIAVIMQLAEAPDGFAVSQLSDSLHIPQATAYRILRTFIQAGWVRQRDDRLYELGTGLLPVAHALKPYDDLMGICRPLLEKLSAQTQLGTKLSVRERREQIALDRAESPRPYSVTGKVGSRFHILLGATGAALLCKTEKSAIMQMMQAAPEVGNSPDAQKIFDRLEEFKDKGVTMNREGVPHGIHAMSAPVHNPNGTIAGAITVIGFKGDFDGEREVVCRIALLNTVQDAERQLAESRKLYL